MAALMTKAEFARLCQISGAMVTKRIGEGLIAMRGGQVDAEKSLANLEGRLDHDKWTEARRKLDGRAQAPSPALAVDNDARDAREKPVPDAPADQRPSAKAQKDQVELQIRQLDLAERQGQLVDVVEVRLAIEDAVATFWSEVDRGRRLACDAIAAELKLDAAQANKLRTLIARRDRQLREHYSALMQGKADEIAPPKSAVA